MQDCKGVLVPLGSDKVTFKVGQLDQACEAGYRYFVFLPKLLVPMSPVCIS